MEVTINGVKKEVSKEEMKDRVIGYYDAVGIKHFYLEVDEMDDEELKAFYLEDHPTQYIMEEFVNGLIISYDGIANLEKDVIFETSHVFPNPIMDVVNDASSMYYYSLREIPYDLKLAGKACVKTFYTAGRCFHMEFFRLLEDNETLEVTVFDYEPTDFLYNTYKDLAAWSGEGEFPMEMHMIRYHFTKVK